MNININVVPEEDTVIPMEVDMAVTDGSGVESVNGKTGAVVLTAQDVGAMSANYKAPVTSVDGKTGAVTVLPSGGSVGQVLTRVIGGVGWANAGGSSAVQSVNGKTGIVVLSASDVGALPSSTVVPTKTSQLQNDSGFITSAPVSSVNGMTGAVVIDNASTTSAGLMSATDKTNLNTLMDDYSSALVALGVIT